MGRDIKSVLGAQLGNHNSKGNSGKGGSYKTDPANNSTMAQNSNTVGRNTNGGRAGCAGSVEGRGPDGDNSRNS